MGDPERTSSPHLMNKHSAYDGTMPPCRFRLKPIAAAVSMACITGTVTGWAQETEQQQPTILEEITVTATRREQSILEIPYNITAVSGELLDRANITDMSGLTRMIPGVTFIEGGPRGNGVNSGIIMRGINANPAGNGAFVPNTSSQTVSTFMDETN